MPEHPQVKKSNLTLFTETNAKWTTDLNIKHKTIKLPENSRGETLQSKVLSVKGAGTSIG